MTSRSALSLAAAVSLLLLLAGCVNPDASGYRAANNPAYGRSPQYQQSPPGTGAPASPKPTGPPPSIAQLTADPTLFKGMAGTDVTSLLGDPNFRRRDSPAEIWQYYGTGCVIDLFLYDEAGVQRVNHVEVRSRTPGQSPNPACVPQLLGGKWGQPVS